MESTGYGEDVNMGGGVRIVLWLSESWAGMFGGIAQDPNRIQSQRKWEYSSLALIIDI